MADNINEYQVTSIVNSLLAYQSIPMESCGNTCKKCGIRRISKSMCCCHPIMNENGGWNDNPFKVNFTNNYTNFKLDRNTVVNILTAVMNKVMAANSVSDKSLKLLVVNPSYQSHDDGGEELSFGLTIVNCNEHSPCRRVKDVVQIIDTTGEMTIEHILEQLDVQVCNVFPISIVYTELTNTLGMVCNDLESGGIH